MRLGSFFELVEIRTKLASMIPFLLGTVYTLYRFNTFKPLNFILMFGALILIDMFTTALNNYFDYKRARKRHGYNYENHNTIVRDQLKGKNVLFVISIMFAAATLLGVALALNTNIIVLAIGALSFLVGICYSFGPVPISRTPLGEIFSGFFMGFVIVFLSIFIHIYDRNVVTLGIEGFKLLFGIDIMEMLYILLLALLPVCGIANIMLANNICDIEDDIENRRYTLPVFIGKERALLAYRSLYYIAYADMAVLVILKIVPLLCAAAFLTFIPVRKNIKLFYASQTKKGTFVLAVKNFFLTTAPLLLLFWIAWAVLNIIR